MAILAAIGQARSPEGREAGLRSASQALEQLNRQSLAERDAGGRIQPVFAWMMASHTYPIADVLAGAQEALGNVQVLGFSTSGELSAAGRERRTVITALLAGTDLQARAGWWGEYSRNALSTVEAIQRMLKPETGEITLLVADGFNGDTAQLQALAQDGITVSGCLSGGDVRRGRTYQIGGRTSGSGGLAAAVLSGDILIGQGATHGWLPVGAMARVSRVQDQWVRLLDDRPPAETYARLFGSPAYSWSRLPLSDLVRVYPLAIASEEGFELRSPLRVEADGSLRMNTILAEGQLVDIMIGSQNRCRQAARQAAQQALRALGPTRPKLALLLVDAAWQALLDVDPMIEVEAVRDVIGANVPIAGGYTFGQVYRPRSNAPLSLLNGNILVILFGGRSVESDEVVA